MLSLAITYFKYFYICRVGRNVKLSIRESLDNGTDKVHDKEAVLPGQHTIFNLDREKSKLYIGGVPSDAKLQGINFPAFEGQIEELMIGDTPVGLWNFVNAAKLKGARQRCINYLNYYYFLVIKM